MTKRTSRPRIESLEDRLCPTLTIRQLPGNLIISGSPTATAPNSLQVNGAGGNRLQILDGTANLGTYPVTGRLTFQLTSYNVPITIDLNGQSIPGDLILGLGLGNRSMLVANPNEITILEGTIGGSVIATGGAGNDTINFGDSTVANAVRVGGNLTFAAPSNRFSGNGNDLAVRGNSTVGGSISLANVPHLQLGESAGAGATVGGNLSAANSLAHFESNTDINGTTVIGGNVNVVGTSRFSFQGDFFLLEGGATIRGNTSVNLGDNINLWELAGTFQGNVSVTGGSGSAPLAFLPVNEISFTDGTSVGTVAGSFTAHTGNGSTAFDFPLGAAVAGNVSLTFGNGINDLGGGTLFSPFGPGIDGLIGGNLTVVLGNAINFLRISQIPGGLFTYRGGNLGDTVVLAPSATTTGTWLVDLRFGSGDDTLTLADAALDNFLNGRVDGGGAVTVNTFNQGVNWSLLPTLVVANF